MCPMRFTSTIRDAHLSVSWGGKTRLELMQLPEISRGYDSPEISWNLARLWLSLTQARLGSPLTGIIRIRHFLPSPGLPSALGNSTLIVLPTFPNSTMPDHSTMGTVGWTSIFHGSGSRASRSSTLRWAPYRMDW